MAPEQLHVTLRFLGELAEADAEAVRGVLRAPFETRAFTAELSGPGRFPTSGPPRGVWSGIDEGREDIAALRTELDRRLAAVGFPSETRPLRGHLTLGRMKGWPARDRPALARALSGVRLDAPRWVVDRVILYESRQTQAGVRYHVLESTSLTAGVEAPRRPGDGEGVGGRRGAPG